MAKKKNNEMASKPMGKAKKKAEPEFVEMSIDNVVEETPVAEPEPEQSVVEEPVAEPEPEPVFDVVEEEKPVVMKAKNASFGYCWNGVEMDIY